MKELGYFVYQIYPKSFLDTTGNGIGDLNGIRKKLTYIADLGFDYVWLTPIYVSPQNDNGYDVADYYRIDSLFGSEAEFDLLVKEAEALGLKIMMDIVFNHTSDQHEWFKRALKGEEKYIDYYIWRKKPTTWASKFGGSAWEYIERLDKYYLHLFDKTQPDLNWENPAVRQELYDIVNYWIKRGVKGFRFDVINLISKKYPLKNGEEDGRYEYTDGPRVHEFLKKLRKNTFANDSEILTVGEMSSTSIQQCIKYAQSDRTELDSVFHFQHLKTDYQNGYKWSTDFFDFKALCQTLIQWQLAMQRENVVDTLFWSCHDQPRIASRFNIAPTKDKQIKKVKSLAMMMYLMRGISYIYQGEEIGMENYEYSSFDEIVDVEAKNYYINNNQQNKEKKLRALTQKSRDNARTPMQWTEKGGFTLGKPWIKTNPKTKMLNVKNQLEDKNSILKFYHNLINLKKNDSVLREGIIEFENHENLFMYTRLYEQRQYRIITNMWDEKITISCNNIQRIIINNGCEINNGDLIINEFSSILYEIK